jgi:hypothetical protein
MRITKLVMMRLEVGGWSFEIGIEACCDAAPEPLSQYSTSRIGLVWYLRSTRLRLGICIVGSCSLMIIGRSSDNYSILAGVADFRLKT